jgi:hypothetical protein
MTGAGASNLPDNVSYGKILNKGGVAVQKWWVILAAFAIGLSLLACEEALEKGSIEGNVKDDGQNVRGAFVLLLEEGKMLAGEAPLGNGSVTNAQGNYAILLVEPNTNYYVVAVKDVDGDTAYTPGVDPVGYYGRYSETTRLWYPAPVSVGSGEKKKGINIADMHILPGF